LLDADADVFSTDGKKKTAIHLSAGMGHSAATQELIARGIDTLAVDSEGLTPYELALHMQTDKDFKNQNGYVSDEDWAQIRYELTIANAALEQLDAVHGFAEDGIQKLQAAVRGKRVRKSMNAIAQSKLYPFTIHVERANGLYTGASGKAAANPLCVVTVNDGESEMQLFTFKTNTIR
jgi:hypothetical protein